MMGVYYMGPERRGRRPPRRPPPVIQAAEDRMDLWLVRPKVTEDPNPTVILRYPRQQLEPTRIDFYLPEPSETTLDYHLPDEEPLWVDWAAERLKREAMDSGDGYSEAIEMSGNQACIKRTSLITSRIVEKQDRLFRFAQDHDIDKPDPDLPKEPAPARIYVPPGNRMADQIRAHSKADRIRAILHRVRKERARGARSQIPWGYVMGLGSALTFFIVVKLFHLLS